MTNPNDKKNDTVENRTPEQCSHFWAQAGAVLANYVKLADEYMLDTAKEDGVTEGAKEEVLHSLTNARTAADTMFGASMRVVTSQRMRAQEEAERVSAATYRAPNGYQVAAPTYGVPSGPPQAR